jgi:PleD family two-component response regulator
MQKKKIFIVDDSEFVLTAATAALEAADYDVEAMSCWEDLNKKLSNSKPDLILMDVNMPEMVGDFALMFFKEERNIQSVPILLFSDINVKELEERATSCGANGFISKGWGIERLVEAVDGHLRSV